MLEEGRWLVLVGGKLTGRWRMEAGLSREVKIQMKEST